MNALPHIDVSSPRVRHVKPPVLWPILVMGIAASIAAIVVSVIVWAPTPAQPTQTPAKATQEAETYYLTDDQWTSLRIGRDRYGCELGIGTTCKGITTQTVTETATMKTIRYSDEKGTVFAAVYGYTGHALGMAGNPEDRRQWKLISKSRL